MTHFIWLALAHHQFVGLALIAIPIIWIATQSYRSGGHPDQHNNGQYNW